jgi:hypothetical protein
MSDNLFTGAKYELLLASRLTEKGIIVSAPLIDIGVDLIASNRNFSNSLPIQVKFKSTEKNIFFTGKEIDSYSPKNVYIAYFLGDSEWYMPFKTFLDLAERPPHRKDRAGYIKIKDKKEQIETYHNERGFAAMVKAIESA